MAVVVIVGILASLAVVGYRKYINSARSSEAVQMVGSIRAAQEAYRSETLTYLSVSTNLKTYYPTNSPTNKKVPWGGTGNNADRWRMLNVTTDGAVYYGYAVVAGGPGTTPPAGDLEIKQKPTFTAVPEPWYVVQAKGNVNGDTVYSYAVATSFTNDIYRENEGE